MGKFVISAFADEIDENLDSHMDVLKQHDIKFIELRRVDGKKSKNITEHSIDEVKEVKRRLDARGFKISAVGSTIGKIGITDDFAPHLELFKHTLEIACVLETKYIRLFSFYTPKGENPDNYGDAVLDRWYRFVNAADGTGITLLHENEKHIYGDTPERCLHLLKELNSKNVRAVFDPANFVQCNVITCPDAYKLLMDYIEYIHIKDALFSNQQVVPAGEGDGQIKDILTALSKHGYQGFLSLEPHLAHFEGFGTLEPDSEIRSMPDGGRRRFAIALHALNKLLKQIGDQI